MSSFFRNVDARGDSIPLGDGRSRIHSLRARAVLVDLEEGVVNQVLNGPLRELFDSHQVVSDVSGAGNNWAVGHLEYGPRYRALLSEQLHAQVEQCDSPQSFFLLHSLGGGTGSGLGTYILDIMRDEFPDLYRFSTAVFPSSELDDVHVSPYNSILALNELAEHADCVLPVDNQALTQIVDRVDSVRGGAGGAESAGADPGAAAASTATASSPAALRGSAITDSPDAAVKKPRRPRRGTTEGDRHRRGAAGSSEGRSRAPGRSTSAQSSGASAASPHPRRAHAAAEGAREAAEKLEGGKGKAADKKTRAGTKGTKFDSMNNICANMLTHLTSSMRFEGTLNVDLNEITTNLVPYPRLHFLVPALSPLYASADVGAALQPRSLDGMFTEAFDARHQLIDVNPRESTYLACGLLLRGGVTVSDIQRNIASLRSGKAGRAPLKMVPWNADGFKIGLCTVPALRQPYSLLCLANNACISKRFQHMLSQFNRLYRVKAQVHHYTRVDGMDVARFDEAKATVVALAKEYAALDSAHARPETPRLRPLF